MFRLFTSLVVSMLLVDFAAAETAKLKMRFVFDGEPPVQEQLKVAAVVASVLDERLVVDPSPKESKTYWSPFTPEVVYPNLTKIQIKTHNRHEF